MDNLQSLFKFSVAKLIRMDKTDKMGILKLLTLTLVRAAFFGNLNSDLSTASGLITGTFSYISFF